MTSTTVKTYRVTVYIAGEIQSARYAICQDCWREGLCVTLTPTEFIYTAGLESGVAVGFINYPRFPKEPEEIFDRAKNVAYRLMRAMFQRSCCIVADDKTEWFTIEPPALKAVQS